MARCAVHYIYHDGIPLFQINIEIRECIRIVSG